MSVPVPVPSPASFPWPGSSSSTDHDTSSSLTTAVTSNGQETPGSVGGHVFAPRPRYSRRLSSGGSISERVGPSPAPVLSSVSGCRGRGRQKPERRPTLTLTRGGGGITGRRPAKGVNNVNPVQDSESEFDREFGFQGTRVHLSESHGRKGRGGRGRGGGSKASTALKRKFYYYYPARPDPNRTRLYVILQTM
jgi:hypothetical protein